MALLREVNPVQPDAYSPIVAQDLDGVSVENSAVHETLEPLDARQDEDMKGNWHLAFFLELPLQILKTFSEAIELLILNSRKQHRVATTPVN